MRKAKLQNEKKYYELIVVPPSNSGVRSLRFSSLYFKLRLCILMIVVALISIGVFISYTIVQNKKLASYNSDLAKQIINQQQAFSNQRAEIEEQNSKMDQTENLIKDFRTKYKEMTDSYLISRASSSKVSKASDGNERAFLDDANTLKKILDGLENVDVKRNNAKDDLIETKDKLDMYKDSLPTFWPVDSRISSEFGNRRDPITFVYKFHGGVDFAANYNDKIKAAGSGYVAFAGWYGDYGYTVIINHGYGLTTLYGHNYKLLVTTGQQIKKGDYVSHAGSSGRSTGVHVHFEVRLNDVVVDPMSYLDKK